jgi:hypothetical protein
MKTSKLKGAALDWAVWACEKPDDEFLHQRRKCRPYSTDWAQGGPIIERENIAIAYWETTFNPWKSWVNEIVEYGPTPLIAAMRCYVASKLGDDVDVPDELV